MLIYGNVYVRIRSYIWPYMDICMIIYGRICGHMYMVIYGHMWSLIVAISRLQVVLGLTCATTHFSIFGAVIMDLELLVRCANVDLFTGHVPQGGDEDQEETYMGHMWSIYGHTWPYMGRI